MNEPDTDTDQGGRPMGNLYAALAKAQGAFLPIAKNRSVLIRTKVGGEYKFDYADLEASIKASRPALSANGLAVLQVVNQGWLYTTLGHSSGESVGCTRQLPGGGDDPKLQGASLTYFRRYDYNALLCLAADDDLDQDGIEIDDKGGNGKPPRPERREDPVHTEHPRRREPGPPPGSDSPAGPDDNVPPSNATQGQCAWLKKKLMSIEGGEEVLAEHGVSLDQPIPIAKFNAIKTQLMAG